jgi:integrase
MRLTDTNVRKLALPAGANEKTFWDDELPAFGVRVRATGGASFVIQYRSGAKQRRLVLGSTQALSLGKARSMAKEQLAVVRLGSDPFAAKEHARAAAGETFGALLPAYLEARKTGIGAKKVVERWHFQISEFLTAAAKPLHDKAPRAITRAQVSDLIDAVTKYRGTGAANKFRATLSAYWVWLVQKGRADANPVVGTAKPAIEVPRDRAPTDAELRQIWHGGKHEFGAILKLLLLTGSRRDMIGDLRWSEIDFDAKLISLPAERMKNGKPFEIPMSKPVIELLKAQPRREGRDLVFGRGKTGFNGWSKSKAELDERVPLPAWTLHDFRRSFSTTLNETLKVPPHIVEAALSHAVVGGKIAATYNKATFRDEKREALEKWASHIAKHVSGENVVRLRKRG